MTWQKPLVMGVVNATPDSFSDGGEFLETVDAVAKALELVSQGAEIIDIGGESTRPGALRVPIKEEQDRVIPVVEKLKATAEFLESKTIISVDTMNAETAQIAIAAGAEIINDVSGGLADRAMFEVLRDTNARYIVSHWRGFSDRMDSLNNYESVAKDVAQELRARVESAEKFGIDRERLIIDPGLGFAKDVEQNWHLVARLDELEKLELPILVGASRKRFIAGALDSANPSTVSNQRRDLGSAVLTALLLQRKLWALRVHNVPNTKDAIAIVAALRLAHTQTDGQS
jgi:dihydropteroate synthase